MVFADESIEDFSQKFNCGWPERRQSATDIAVRTQRLARLLSAIDPAFGPIRPSPMRKFRAGDPGPILDVTPAELADRIERRARFDPPRYPAPVSPKGYRASYRNDTMGGDPSALDVSMHVGKFGAGRVENDLQVCPATNHPLWRDPERGIQVIDAMVESWDPEWVCAYGTIDTTVPPSGELTSRVRPWLAWTAKPLQPRPVPPFFRPFPCPFPLDEAGPPAEVRAWRGGELCIWP